jgi:hypothetical protein
MAVDLDDGGIDCGVFYIRLVRTGIEQPLEDIGFDPVAVSLEDRVPLAELSRQVALGATAQSTAPLR